MIISPFCNVKSIYSSRVPHKIFAAIFFIICGLNILFLDTVYNILLKAEISFIRFTPHDAFVLRKEVCNSLGDFFTYVNR